MYLIFFLREANSRPDPTVKDQAEEMGQIQEKAGGAGQTSIALDEVAEVAEIKNPDTSVEVPTEVKHFFFKFSTVHFQVHHVSNLENRLYGKRFLLSVLL